MAPASGPSKETDPEAIRLAHAAATRTSLADESLVATIGEVELRHLQHAGWVVAGRDPATGLRVRIESGLWPEAERDAWLEQKGLVAALVGIEATIRVRLQGRRHGREFTAQFAEIVG